MSWSIGWATPLDPASDIGAFSRNLLCGLDATAAQRDIAPAVLLDGPGPHYHSTLPVVPLRGDASDRELACTFETVIYNIGNNSRHHRHINVLARQVPGVVVVHDLVMHHFMAWELLEQRRRPDLYAQLMTEFYGAAALEVLDRSRICRAAVGPAYAPWDTSFAAEFPLIEPFLRSASAVVVHSGFAEALALRLTTAPVLRLRLPWDKTMPPDDLAVAQFARATASVLRCTVVSFGHIGREKRLDRLIDAFAASAMLQDRAQLIIAGFAKDTACLAELQEMVAQHGLGNCVRIEHDVSNSRLASLKQQADLFVNLRAPNTEGASGSLTEQLSTGRPVLAYPTGSFAEVAAAGALVAVEIGAGQQGLTAALENLVGSPASRVNIGARGRTWVRDMDRTSYADALMAFLHVHRERLRARACCRVAARSARGVLDPDILGVDWLDDLAAVRQFDEAAAHPVPMLDARPFRDFLPDDLAGWLTVGVFGQARDSRFGATITRLLAEVSRARLHRAAAAAFYLFVRVGRTDQRASSSAAAGPAPTPMTDQLAWAMLIELDGAALGRICYLGLLGREARPGEAERIIAACAGHNGAALLSKFLGSDAVLAQMPDGIDTELLAWAGAASAAASPAATLPVGQWVDFSSAVPDCTQYLVTGWHPLEADGVWSCASVAAVRFGLPEITVPVPTAQLWLRIQVFALRPGEPRDLLVLNGDAKLHACQVPGMQWVEVGFALPSDRSEFTLLFDCGRTGRPVDGGYNLDMRDLGFKVAALAVLSSPAV